MAVQVGRLPENRGRDQRPPGVLLSRARPIKLPDRFIGMLCRTTIASWRVENEICVVVPASD